MAEKKEKSNGSGGKRFMEINPTQESEGNLLIAERDELGLLIDGMNPGTRQALKELLSKVMEINIKKASLPCIHCLKMLFGISKAFFRKKKPRKAITGLVESFDCCSRQIVARGQSKKEGKTFRRRFPRMLVLSSAGKPPAQVPMELIVKCPLDGEIIEGLRRILQA